MTHRTEVEGRVHLSYYMIQGMKVKLIGKLYTITIGKNVALRQRMLGTTKYTVSISSILQ